MTRKIWTDEKLNQVKDKYNNSFYTDDCEWILKEVNNE